MVKCLLNPKLKRKDRIQIDLTNLQSENFDISYGGQQVDQPQKTPKLATNAQGIFVIQALEHSGDTRGDEWYTNLVCTALGAVVPKSGITINAVDAGLQSRRAPNDIINNERSPDLLNIIKDAVSEEILAIWTNLPCEVVSYDPDAVTVEVKPSIRVPVRTPEGSIKMIEIPILQDVPVMFPCAGGFTITHPIDVGDECIVSFSSRNIDLWWQSGGVQNPFDTRHHDLSDGFAFFKPQSQAKKIENISTENLEIRSDDNATKIQITRDGIINFLERKRSSIVM